MCGIGGIVKVTPAGDAAKAALGLPGGGREAIPEAWLDILDESIRHRGPDGQGRFRDRVVRADGSVVMSRWCIGVWRSSTRRQGNSRWCRCGVGRDCVPGAMFCQHAQR